LAKHCLAYIGAKVKKDKITGKTLTVADWDKDGEWGTGNLSEDGSSLMQEYLWKKTMAGKKYASQAGHAKREWWVM